MDLVENFWPVQLSASKRLFHELRYHTLPTQSNYVYNAAYMTA